ncbi:hypothetical protein [Acrocarpospora sp. B8E8]|uniref:hypothetical protein n=1 Tax=Acrocarpospora sp. B8E8 TaxID=3153572 RepID=UPI00325F8E56
MVKLPKSLILTLMAVGTVLILISVCLELGYLDLLQSHPILVNLLSGAIGFCWVSVFVATAINWYASRHRREDIARGLKEIRLIFFEAEMDLTRRAEAAWSMSRSAGEDLGFDTPGSMSPENEYYVITAIKEAIPDLLRRSGLQSDVLVTERYGRILDKLDTAFPAPASEIQPTYRELNNFFTELRNLLREIERSPG